MALSAWLKLCCCPAVPCARPNATLGRILPSAHAGRRVELAPAHAWDSPLARRTRGPGGAVAKHFGTDPPRPRTGGRGGVRASPSDLCHHAGRARRPDRRMPLPPTRDVGPPRPNAWTSVESPAGSRVGLPPRGTAFRQPPQRLCHDGAPGLMHPAFPCRAHGGKGPARSMAQPGSALVLGTRGRRFESCCSDQPHGLAWPMAEAPDAPGPSHRRRGCCNTVGRRCRPVPRWMPRASLVSRAALRVSCAAPCVPCPAPGLFARSSAPRTPHPAPRAALRAAGAAPRAPRSDCAPLARRNHAGGVPCTARS